MKIHCKPLLGTYVEISIDQDASDQHIDDAFAVIKQVQNLMSFHDPISELNVINQTVHLEPVAIHPWTAEVLKISQDIYEQSNGLFNCGIGHRLVAAGLLPCHIDLSIYQMSGIEDIRFIDPQIIISSKPLCLDLGGIAKGFAVDKAVEHLQSNGVKSGCVNAGGDLRVFGSIPRSIHIRNPIRARQLIEIGSIQNGAIATSSLYFSKRDQLQSHIINPLARDASEVHLHFSDSFSIVANECVYADALTKVLALSGEMDHPCLNHFGAKAIRLAS
jgi:thiamine biosynthesis lipoprotein